MWMTSDFPVTFRNNTYAIRMNIILFLTYDSFSCYTPKYTLSKYIYYFYVIKVIKNLNHSLKLWGNIDVLKIFFTET